MFTRLSHLFTENFGDYWRDIHFVEPQVLYCCEISDIGALFETHCENAGRRKLCILFNGMHSGKKMSTRYDFSSCPFPFISFHSFPYPSFSFISFNPLLPSSIHLLSSLLYYPSVSMILNLSLMDLDLRSLPHHYFNFLPSSLSINFLNNPIRGAAGSAHWLNLKIKHTIILYRTWIEFRNRNVSRFNHFPH